MQGLFPQLSTPVEVVEPDRPYSGYLVWLSIAPRMDKIEQGIQDASASLRLLPYRILSDGSVDVAPDRLARTVNIGSVVDESQANPRLAQAAATIAAMLQQLFGAE